MADEKLDTQLVNAGHSKKYTLGAVDSMIQHTSLLVFGNIEAKKHATRNRVNGELFYGRRGMLTHFSLQQAIHGPEGGAGCVLFPYGAAVVANSILAFVEQGDHVLMTNTAYEPSQDFCSKALSRLGAMTSWLGPLIGADIVKHLQPDTKIVFLESPGSITMEARGIPAVVATARGVVPDVIIMIDNTWAAGVLFKAPDFGVDISIQATTKYLVRHSGTMIGTAACNACCWEQLRENVYLTDQVVDTDTACITSRDLRTLGVRLRQHHKSSLKTAEWLAEHPQVARVNHPALSGSEGHEFWKRDFIGSNGLSSFVSRKELNDEELANYLDNFGLFSMAYSWGGCKSLILVNRPEHIAAIHPQGKIDFSGTLIRLHIGLEDVDDLITDLDAGFTRIV